MNSFRRALVPLAFVAGVTTAADAAPTVTDIMGNGADTELSAMALRVANCAFQYGQQEPFNEVTEGIAVGGEAAVMSLKNNGDTYQVAAVDFTVGPIPDALLVLSHRGIYEQNGFFDVELDGIPEEGDPTAYEMALRHMDAVCRANATPKPPIRARKDCPQPEVGLGVGALSQFYREHAISVVKISGEMDPDPEDGVDSPWGLPYNCTGYVVGDGLIATAQHCITQENPSASTNGHPRFVNNTDIHVEWPAAFDAKGNISQLYMTHGLATVHTFDDTDFALIAINPDAPHLHPLTLDTSPDLSAPHISFGHPLGADWTLAVTRGGLQPVSNMVAAGDVVSAGPHFEMRFPSTCSSVDSGSSGGPLLDASGGVVGTIVARTEAAEAVWAVPSSKTVAMMAATGSMSIPAGEPVYLCPVREELALLTLQGPQVSLVSDEPRCVEVAR